jgi:GNAT superfamily N-acetyltransferase
VFRETPETVAAQIAKGGAVILVRDGEAIGSGRWVAVPGPGGQDDWMEIKRIGVLPEHTGQGLGAVIVAALEAAGRSAGKQGAQLAIRVDQPRLIDFYAALGYVPAADVELTTVNPRSPPPFGMRKIFKD